MREKAAADRRPSNMGRGVLIWLIKNAIFLILLGVVLFAPAGIAGFWKRGR